MQKVAHALPITHYLDKLGMERRDASGKWSWHKHMREPRPSQNETPASDAHDDIRRRLTLDPQTFYRDTCPRLVTVCRGTLSSNRKEKLDQHGAKLLTDTLKKMFSGDEVEITPALPANFMFKFEQPRSIHTVAALKRETSILLRGPRQLLLCIAQIRWMVVGRENHQASGLA